MQGLTQNLTLYTYCRSSAAYRVRIALNYKGLAYQSEYVHLLKDGGQEKSEDYRKINPQQLVPSFADGNNIITQSLAIIEYIEETHPTPALLPSSASDRAFVRSLAMNIACDIHPLNNLRVLTYLDKELNIDKENRETWYRHWINEGFSALEEQLARIKNKSDYCFSNQITLADICLIPQVYNGMRFKCNIESYPIINQIYQNCMKLAAFKQSSPEEQVDFENAK